VWGWISRADAELVFAIDRTNQTNQSNQSDLSDSSDSSDSSTFTSTGCVPASTFRLSRGKRVEGFFTIIEMDGAIRKNLVGLMSLAGEDDEIRRVGECAARLRRYARNIVISLGAGGVFALSEGGRNQRLHGHPVVCRSAVGAGDAFIGELIVRQLGGTPFFEALKYANAAAAIVIGSTDGLRHAVDPQELEALVSASAGPA